MMYTHQVENGKLLMWLNCKRFQPSGLTSKATSCFEILAACRCTSIRENLRLMSMRPNLLLCSPANALTSYSLWSAQVKSVLTVCLCSSCKL